MRCIPRAKNTGLCSTLRVSEVESVDGDVVDMLRGLEQEHAEAVEWVRERSGPGRLTDAGSLQVD